MDKKNRSRTVKDSAARIVPTALLVLAFAVGAWLMPRTAQAYNPDTHVLRECKLYTGSTTNFPRIDESSLLDDWANMLPEADFSDPNSSWIIGTTFPNSNNSGNVTAMYISNKQDGTIFWTEDPQNTGEIVLAFPANMPDSWRLNRLKSSDTSSYASLTGQMGDWFGVGNRYYPSLILVNSKSPPVWGDDIFAYTTFQAYVNPIPFEYTNDGQSCVVGYQNITVDPNLDSALLDKIPFFGEQLGYTPDIKLRGVLDWQGTFSDDNFLSIDELPFTCEGGLAPVISGELWNDSGTPTMIDTFTANATGLFKINFDEFPVNTDYRIVSWYICDDNINYFPDSAHYSFTITSYGTLQNESFYEDCIKDTFPFIDFNACVENIFRVIDMLYFKEVVVGSGWNPTTGCYTLTTIHLWIHVQNPVVCPAFGGTLRALVTPFVVFLLGLGTVHIINRGIGKGEA